MLNFTDSSFELDSSSKSSMNEFIWYGKAAGLFSIPPVKDDYLELYGFGFDPEFLCTNSRLSLKNPRN